MGGREVSLPLWFLSIYVLVIAAVPALVSAHRRFGAKVFLVLAAGTVLADVGHYGSDQAWIAIANYAFVWLAVFELGFLWRDGVFAARRAQWLLLGGGLAVVGALVAWFDYPTSMITLSEADRSNAFPHPSHCSRWAWPKPAPCSSSRTWPTGGSSALVCGSWSRRPTR